MLYGTQCCGVREFSGLDLGAVHTLKEVAQYLERDRSWRFLTFTDITQDRYGSRLCAYIRKHGLGRVVSTRSATNPNTDNRITVWVWEVNHTAIRQWGAKHGV